MRKKICNQCGNPFETNRMDNFLCPSCSADYFKSASVRQRTCRQCGAVFPGGPRAWYCPDCRAIRAKEASRRAKRNGTSRKLGSTDRCEVCGKDYIVNSARQRYCKNCAPDVVADHIRARSRQYNAENREELGRKKQDARSNRSVCVICGAVYDADTPTVTCSPECAKALRKLRQDEADIRRGRRKSPPGIYVDYGKPKSGVTGVTIAKSGRWRAVYRKNGLGTFDTVEEAAAAIEKYKEENKND